MAMRCCSPPESWCGILCALLVKPTACSTSSMRDTDVPNWKSEAAFTSDGERDLGIFFAGSPNRNGKISDSRGKTYEEVVSQQRIYYTTIDNSYPYLVSSAPMLIDNYEPVGEYFCDYTLTDRQVNALNGEDPNRHQRVRHPRTAVALTENNHFIMLVVDGRTNYSSGMSGIARSRGTGPLGTGFKHRRSP